MFIALIIIFVCLLAYLWAFDDLESYIGLKIAKARDIEKLGKEKYEENEKELESLRKKRYEWKPTYKLEHRGLKVFNIPFVPEANEVFYIENEYDEEANLFIQENIDLIKEVLATKGLTFVYLPFVKVTKEIAESMLAYYTADQNCSIDDNGYEEGMKSSLLLDYMIIHENRQKITRGFCWYNTSYSLFKFKKVWYTFDYISFDGAEARQHPREVLEDMLPELGNSNTWEQGWYCKEKNPSDGFADDNFDEDTKKLLEEIQEKLGVVRLKGISEAVIARYTKPCPKLSRMTVSNSFKITLNDYDNKEIIMEPLVKAVFILFLRHREGILFKELPDYRRELEIIYRAVKDKNNNIEKQMRSGFTPQISKSVNSLTNPQSNSINEKCTRIKEAFLMHFHESIASNYYVQGYKASEKMITLPRNLLIWEGQ